MSPTMHFTQIGNTNNIVPACRRHNLGIPVCINNYISSDYILAFYNIWFFLFVIISDMKQGSINYKLFKD
jgi:hypothetical protein